MDVVCFPLKIHLVRVESAEARPEERNWTEARPEGCGLHEGRGGGDKEGENTWDGTGWSAGCGRWTEGGIKGDA